MNNIAQRFYQEINQKYDQYIGGNQNEQIVLKKDHEGRENNYNRFVNRITIGTVESTFQSMTSSYDNGLKVMHDRIIPIIEVLHKKDGMEYPLGYQKALEIYKNLPQELNFPQDPKSKEMLFYFVMAHEMAHAHYPEKNVDPYVNQKLNDIPLTYTSKVTFEGLKNEMRADAFAYAMLKDKYQNEPQYNKVINGIEKIRLAGSLLGMTTGDHYNFIKLYDNNSKFMKDLPAMDSKTNANEITRRTSLQSLNTLKEYGIFVQRSETPKEIINTIIKTEEGREALFNQLMSKNINSNKELCDYANNKVTGTKVDVSIDNAIKESAKKLDANMSQIVNQIQSDCSSMYDIEYGNKNNLNSLLKDIPIQAIGVSSKDVQLDLKTSVANFYKDKEESDLAQNKWNNKLRQ